jgi:hypothetical protein
MPYPHAHNIMFTDNTFWFFISFLQIVRWTSYKCVSQRILYNASSTLAIRRCFDDYKTLANWAKLQRVSESTLIDRDNIPDNFPFISLTSFCIRFLSPFSLHQRRYSDKQRGIKKRLPGILTSSVNPSPPFTCPLIILFPSHFL